jgi:hypothetical protein
VHGNGVPEGCGRFKLGSERASENGVVHGLRMYRHDWGLISALTFLNGYLRRFASLTYRNGTLRNTVLN